MPYYVDHANHGGYPPLPPNMTLFVLPNQVYHITYPLFRSVCSWVVFHPHPHAICGSTFFRLFAT